jgi:hypothetical protein
MEIRIRADGRVVTEREFREMHPNVSFPAVLSADILTDFGGDAVLAAPAPSVTETQTAYRNGVVQDGLGNWVQAWAVRELTAEEIDAAIEDQRNRVRTERNGRLAAEVDSLNPIRWESMTEEMRHAWRDYRQLLLDVPQQADPFNIDWPAKPAV